jgi:hypothetical protein
MVTTEAVKDAFLEIPWTNPQRAAEGFDAWLEGIKREAKADGHREGYATAREDMVSGAFIGGPTYEALRASFSGQRIRRDALEIAAQEAERGYLADEYCDDIAARIRAHKED